jgi:hypothetical protein
VSFVGVEFYNDRLYPSKSCTSNSNGYLSIFSSAGTSLYPNKYISSSDIFSYSKANLAAGTYYAAV